MMSPRPNSDDRGSSNFRHTPLQILHIIASFLRIWSVYSMYRYLSQTGVSVILFIFCCLVPSSILFLLLQKPWKGRPLLNTQMVPSVINGGITALYFILWGKGLKSCGPVRALLAEYSGAVLGVLSAVLYGRRGHVWKKVGGLIAILASFYFLSQGWATETSSPFSFKDSLDAELRTEQVLGMKEMVVPLLAGILSALRRVIARRVSLKGSKSSSSVDLPFSAWAFLSTTLFGIILIFYVDAMAEERLHMVFSSPRHLMVAGGCIIVMEMVYKMDFSLIGFIICSLILGFGIYEATSLDHGRKDTFQKPDLSNGMLGDELQVSSLPT
ncbi:hypothetical protein CISIN_1g018499mg [Citrus sinensis]|uniref:EamA domain-containing protein n=1 Tax=Citrus sinensis TaxID=2711 RepID=A0A067F698_CITSI|nr:hypothetical protein CISIN_1g018499mg [Citrus sinensis]